MNNKTTKEETFLELCDTPLKAGDFIYTFMGVCGVGKSKLAILTQEQNISATKEV